MVHYDLRAVERRWREAQLVNFNEARQRELARLDIIEAELWNAWERSCKRSSSTRDRERRLPGIVPRAADHAADAEEQKLLERVEREISVRIEERDGDPRFMELVLKCVQARARLLGLYPKAPSREGPGEPVRRLVVYLPQQTPDCVGQDGRHAGGVHMHLPP